MSNFKFKSNLVPVKGMFVHSLVW